MATNQLIDQVEEQVRAILAGLGAKGLDVVTRETRLEDMDVDSLDLIELAQVFEDEHHLELTADDFEGVQTFGDTLDVVARRMAG